MHRRQIRFRPKTKKSENNEIHFRLKTKLSENSQNPHFGSENENENEIRSVSIVKQNVSETIRTQPFAEAQTALGKQEILSVERWYLSHCRNSAKTASLCKISLKLVNQLLSYGQKLFLI